MLGAQLVVFGGSIVKLVAKGIEKGDNVEEEEEEEETGTVLHISSRRSLQEEGSDSFAKAFMRMFADLVSTGGGGSERSIIPQSLKATSFFLILTARLIRVE